MAVKTLNVAEKRTFKSGGKKSEMAEKNSRIGRRLISKHGHYGPNLDTHTHRQQLDHKEGYLS